MASPTSKLATILVFSALFFVTTAMVNPIVNPIRNSRKVFEIRKYAQLPVIGTGRNSRAQITGFSTFGSDIYVAASMWGTVYKIDRLRRVTLWFNATQAIKEATGRDINFDKATFSGVRSVVLHPSFNRTGLFYISYLENRPKFEGRFRYLSKPKGDLRAVCDSLVTEFRYNHKTEKVDPMSYREVLRIALPRIDHPIRQMTFQRNMLLIAHGDGSHGYDVFATNYVVGGGQNNDGLGKILRINPLKAASGRPYSIPFTNPFRKNKKYLPEIYALGFRNPHSICYSRAWGIISADVGRNNVEEVNLVKAGGNYGWSEREGTFVHLRPGGTYNGIKPLPDDDAKYGYIYPSAMYGHNAPEGTKGSMTAIAGACPVENKSELNGIYVYSNFPGNGNLYFSRMRRLQRAVTTGPPQNLTQAKTFKAKLTFDHDDKPNTPSIPVTDFLDIVRRDAGSASITRADLRLGRGPVGETMISSKATGGLYYIVGTVPRRNGEKR